MFKTDYKLDPNYMLIISFIITLISMAVYGSLIEYKDFKSLLAFALVPALAIIVYVYFLLYPLILKFKGYRVVGYANYVEEEFVRQYNDELGVVRYIINTVIYEKKF